MNLVKILTAPAAERYDTLMKVIDRANKLQTATVRKAEKLEKARRKIKK